MLKKIKKRQLSIILFYILLTLLGISILIDPVIPAKWQDVVITFLVILNVHYLNERNILFKRIKFFAEDIERNKITEKKKEEFVANITHDLKTPTLAQKSALKILLNDEQLNEEQKYILKELIGSCSYMEDMINTILYTYKYNDGDIKLNCKNFDLISNIRNICLSLSDLACARGQNIILDIEDDVQIYGDELQIKRVIVNLIGNAIKYGQINEDIIVSAKNKGNETIFEVKNKKGEIKEDELNKIFEKFETLNAKSSGLGLYISKKIVEEHKGNIFAKIEGDEIAFGFNLPLVLVNVYAA